MYLIIRLLIFCIVACYLLPIFFDPHQTNLDYFLAFARAFKLKKNFKIKKAFLKNIPYIVSIYDACQITKPTKRIMKFGS